MAKHHGTGMHDVGSETPPGPLLLSHHSATACSASLCYCISLWGTKPQTFPWFFIAKIISVVQHTAQQLPHTARIDTRSIGFTADEKVSQKHNLWV